MATLGLIEYADSSPEVRAGRLAVRGRGLADALSMGYSRVVVHQGRVVARTSAVLEFCDPAVALGPGLPRQSGRGPAGV